MTTASHTPPPPRRFGQILAVIMLGRVAFDTQIRILYPFLPAIGRGLGVPLEVATLLLTVRSLVGISSPVFGYLADRFSRRTLMLGGLAALIAGSVLVGVAPTFGVAMLGFVLLGLSKPAYDQAMQAYIGDTVPYERRGRVMGILEVTWAVAWLVGVPVAGFLIASAGWRSPFLAIAALGAVGFVLTRVLNPDGQRRAHAATQEGEVAHAGSSRKFVFRWPAWATGSTVLTLLVSLLLMFANENLFVVYGVWLEGQFGLSVAALGLASTVIALAELAAEGTAAGIVDRIGKRRAVMAGLALNTIAYLLLPLLGTQLTGALAGMFFMLLAFEFSIVCMLPLISELAPASRGTVVAFNVAAMSAGRMLGSLTAPRLWEAGGLPFNAGLSAAALVVAGIILWRGVLEARSVPAVDPC